LCNHQGFEGAVAPPVSDSGSGASSDAQSRYARSVTVAWGTFSSIVSYDFELSDDFIDCNVMRRRRSSARAVTQCAAQ
jgi:hypothetical protein